MRCPPDPGWPVPKGPAPSVSAPAARSGSRYGDEIEVLMAASNVTTGRGCLHLEAAQSSTLMTVLKLPGLASLTTLLHALVPVQPQPPAHVRYPQPKSSLGYTPTNPLPCLDSLLPFPACPPLSIPSPVPATTPPSPPGRSPAAADAAPPCPCSPLSWRAHSFNRSVSRLASGPTVKRPKAKGRSSRRRATFRRLPSSTCVHAWEQR